MSNEAIENGVRELLARIGKLDPGFSGEADIYRELGVKSAQGLDLLLSLEEEFGITISDDAFGDARTVAKIVDLVAGLKGAA